MKNRFDSDDYEDFGNYEETNDDAANNYISQEEYEALVAQANELQNIQIQFAQTDLNQRLLADTMTMLKSSWTWPFRSMKSKLREIASAYQFLSKLTETSKK